MAETVALIHVHRVSQQALAKALDQVLVEWKYRRVEAVPVPAAGLSGIQENIDRGVGHLCYLLSPERGNWTTIIQTFAERDDAPFLADLANRLSQQLQTHTLAILLHDEGVLFYNLDYRGTPRDGYTSNPQHFADQKLTESEAQQHRHMPKAFTPLLPKHIKIEKLTDLLNGGWWQAFDKKQLDEEGEPLDEELVVDEEERLAIFGGLLQLNGSAGYPFGQWRTTTMIDWRHYQLLQYQAKGRALTMA